MTFKVLDMLSAFMVMFAVIDIIGSIPIILDIKSKGQRIESGKATIVSLLILVTFLFTGEALLGLFGVDISSFAIAGSMILFILAMEMVLGIELFKSSTPAGASIVPLAFPLIAGAGSITTMLSLRAAYGYLEIISALVLNMIFVYFTLRSTRLIERFLGPTGVAVLRKVFGIILLSIAIKLFMSNFVSSLETFFPGLIEKMKNY